MIFRPRRMVAGALAPFIITAECFAAVGEHEKLTLATPPDHSNHSNYHVPGETRGEFSVSLDVSSVSGANTVSRTVYGGGVDFPRFPAASSEELLPAPPTIVLPRPDKAKNKTPRSCATGFPAFEHGPGNYALFSAVESRPAGTPRVKRFLFRRP